MQLFGRKPDIL